MRIIELVGPRMAEGCFYSRNKDWSGPGRRRRAALDLWKSGDGEHPDEVVIPNDPNIMGCMPVAGGGGAPRKPLVKGKF